MEKSVLLKIKKKLKQLLELPDNHSETGVSEIGGNGFPKIPTPILYQKEDGSQELKDDIILLP